MNGWSKDDERGTKEVRSVRPEYEEELVGSGQDGFPEV